MSDVLGGEYPPAIAALLEALPLAPLGPGTPERRLQEKLASLDDAAFGASLVNADMADACRAGLWLAFHFLDESHRISQRLHTPEGNYWHALMHRREPDHANAAYWFRRVGAHPVFVPLRRTAAELAVSAPAQATFLARQTQWDAFAFNNMCEASASETAPCHDLCRRVQRAEWEILFAHCFHRATGSAR